MLITIAFLLMSAAISAPERSLTIELLQERLKSPIQSEGVRTIDLRQLIINLRPENAEFSNQFYQLLQTQLNRSGTPLGLDFSNSLIQGDFIGDKLGLRSPLYAEGISPLLTPQEQQLLLNSRHFSQIPIPNVTVFRGTLKFVQTRFAGTVDFTNSFFLHRVEAKGAIFTQPVNFSGSHWIRLADFSEVIFNRDVNFNNSLFLLKAIFSKAQFRGIANFLDTSFQSKATFSETQFEQLANFTRSDFQDLADFSKTNWSNRALFSKSQFIQPLILSEATFAKAVAFRETQFNQLVNLRAVSLLEQVDFSNARFLNDAYLNVANIMFDSEQAKIIGDAGEIGRLLWVPMLQGNEDVLRNLVRNFRSLQQISDANQVEYTTQKLRRQQLGNSLILGLDNFSPLGWILESLYWLGLSLLLLLSSYGTSFWLVFGVGMVTIAYFGLLFWLLDRFRRRIPQPIVPTAWEIPWMLGSYTLLTFAGVTAIFQSGEQAWLTLTCLGVVILPIPTLLLGKLYRQGRYHDFMDVSYFVEDGSLRQLRLLIGRLPVMPRFEVFRDRYMPILWHRRWNLLNYYDFSLNNLLKIGFNDIRLRDQHLPGIITTLVWYQWSLGILYIALLLWTLSRTIPGLNLLIYLK
ncbi:MAG: pentapeptide repeat-containing protein [Coleofasciculaceae cyanobacterium]